MWSIHYVWPAGLLCVVSGIVLHCYLHLNYTKIAPYPTSEFLDYPHPQSAFGQNSALKWEELTKRDLALFDAALLVECQLWIAM